MDISQKRIGYSIGQKQFFDNAIERIRNYEAYFITISATHKAQLFQNNVRATGARHQSSDISQCRQPTVAPSSEFFVDFY